MQFFTLVTKSFQYLKNDRLVLFLSFIPIFIGSILYYFLGRWIYTDVFSFIKIKISNIIHIDSTNTILAYFLGIILSILLFFLINWTFVLIVSLLASPFNDFLSERIELLHFKKEIKLKNMINGRLKTIFFILFNESKKICFILFINIIALALGWIPILLPLSVLISAIILATNYLDYSWSRHNLTLKECISDYRSSFFTNTFMGLILFLLINIPILNLLIISFSVIFFTLVSVEKNSEV